MPEGESNSKRFRGTVLWYTAKKKMGFIKPDEPDASDIFVHDSDLRPGTASSARATPVTGAPLSHDEAVAFVTSDDCGAVATFLGVTRDTFEGKRVVRLSYEAYVPMAEAEMLKICAVAVGEASVIIAAASPHRKDALAAVAWAIDELKTTVPIWKKEIYAEGDPAWKQNRSGTRTPDRVAQSGSS
ncbi:molybdopterin synthase [Aureococcus anophagefferens]|nr:molybdopterin synthase [Aureococcus anophagefferens]